MKVFDTFPEKISILILSFCRFCQILICFFSLFLLSDRIGIFLLSYGKHYIFFRSHSCLFLSSLRLQYGLEKKKKENLKILPFFSRWNERKWLCLYYQTFFFNKKIKPGKRFFPGCILSVTSEPWYHMVHDSSDS